MVTPTDMDPEMATIQNPECKIQGEPLPEGKYTVISCDIDATGKRLIDEVRTMWNDPRWRL